MAKFDKNEDDSHAHGTQVETTDTVDDSTQDKNAADDVARPSDLVSSTEDKDEVSDADAGVDKTQPTDVDPDVDLPGEDGSDEEDESSDIDPISGKSVEKNSRFNPTYG